MRDQPISDREASKLSQEPGFIYYDIFSQPYSRRIPEEVPGVLAFLHVEEGSEMVERILMLDDLAKGFACSLPFCGPANAVAYRIFPISTDADQRKRDLAERLRLYVHLTEKYRAPQTVWPLDEYSTIPPI
jgi:hypothetical protein